MGHLVDINVLPAFAFLIVPATVVSAVLVVLRRRFARIRRYHVVVACIGALLLNPVVQAIVLMPYSQHRVKAMLGAADKANLSGKTASLAKQVLGDPDEVLVRPSPQIATTDAGIVLWRGEPYTVWLYHTAKLCMLCSDVRLTLNAGGTVDGVVEQ